MDELKPCPFCGDVPEISAWHDAEFKLWNVTIKCVECECEMDDIASDHERAYIKVLSRWNRRAE